MRSSRTLAMCLSIAYRWAIGRLRSLCATKTSLSGERQARTAGCEGVGDSQQLFTGIGLPGGPVCSPGYDLPFSQSWRNPQLPEQKAEHVDRVPNVL